MKVLKEYISEVIGADNRVDGPYTSDLLDDESIHKQSILVPDDIKDKIFNYFVKMGLSRPSKKKVKGRS